MNKDLFKHYNHLGSFNPFYYINDKSIIDYDSNYLDLLKRYHKDPSLDLSAIADILSNRFILGDKTIIEGIKRSPWLAKPNDKIDNWEYYNLKNHKEKILDEGFIAKNLFKLVCNEIKNYIGENIKIGILLSGGMDSRIVAGCLDYLMKTGSININFVTAYTWGNPQSRDVVYAKKIADRLNWDLKHYEVTAEDLWNNFKVSGFRGAEYSGIHLHAIPQIKKDIDVDLLLVGSYGDSIGRGEYEGISVENLKHIGNRNRNFGGFIKENIFKTIVEYRERDIIKYHKQFPENKKYQQNELDFQLHYMRRLLNPCMEVLNETVPTYQIFTNPAVYEFMWSLSPKVRNDKVYSSMMDLFYTKLNDIPWARTGVPYLGKGKPDSYLKNHHSYHDLIHKKLIDRIEERVLSKRISGLNIFNMDAIKSIFRLLKVFKGKNSDYLERLTWLVSLDYFIENNNYAKTSIGKKNFNDLLNAYIKKPAYFVAVQGYRWWRNKNKS